MPVETRIEEKIMLITINRPEARNAIDGETSQAISGALDELENNPELLVGIITGAGDRAFSAGMDLKAFASGQLNQIITEKGGFAGIASRRIDKPLIAAINGSALAGGMEIALSCDMLIAANHATFGIPEVKRGLIAGGGGLFRLPRKLPLTIAMELALTGDTIDAKRAYELGLVNYVVEATELIDFSLNIAKKIARNAPLAISASKRLMRDSLYKPELECWEMTNKEIATIFSSKDALEGAIAFAEKREPKWQGE